MTIQRDAWKDWRTLAPLLAMIVLIAAWGTKPGPLVAGMFAVILAATVLSAVHHAEVVAHRVGEPLGSLLLAVSVTIIEVGLIITLMLTGSEGVSTLARDTVFAAVMISANGIVGLSVLLGSIRHHTALFNSEGAGAGLATLTALATLALVLPNFTEHPPGPQFSGSQLTFAAFASLVLYASFVATQTVRHRDFFLPIDRAGSAITEEHAEPPPRRVALMSGVLLIVALLGVVGLAKLVTPTVDAGVKSLGFPHAVVGVIIAMLVLLPETLAGARAALRDRVQTSMNLAYGSGVASIGLTIPTIALASIWIDSPLTLGLGATHMVLLALTVLTGILTVVPGRATRLNGWVHLSVLAAFLFLSIQP